MAQYIDKSDLVAEIERRLEAISISSNENNRELAAIRGAQQFELINLARFLDTLEVKEVELEKHLKEDIEDVLFDLDGVAVKGATHYLTVEDVKDIAKHFFELGMAVSNKAQKGE